MGVRLVCKGKGISCLDMIQMSHTEETNPTLQKFWKIRDKKAEEREESRRPRQERHISWSAVTQVILPTDNCTELTLFTAPRQAVLWGELLWRRRWWGCVAVVNSYPGCGSNVCHGLCMCSGFKCLGIGLGVVWLSDVG